MMSRVGFLWIFFCCCLSLKLTCGTTIICDPCVNRTSHTIKAIFHGQSEDDFWLRLSATAKQSAADMRVNLDLELVGAERN